MKAKKLKEQGRLSHEPCCWKLSPNAVSAPVPFSQQQLPGDYKHCFFDSFPALLQGRSSAIYQVKSQTSQVGKEIFFFFLWKLAQRPGIILERTHSKVVFSGGGNHVPFLGTGLRRQPPMEEHEEIGCQNKFHTWAGKLTQKNHINDLH